MVSLPQDIIIDIFFKLPIKSISRFRCVCKNWYELFNNPIFIKMHHRHAIENNKFSVLLESYTDSDYRNKDACYSINLDVTSSPYHMVVATNLPSNTFVNVSCDGLFGCLVTSSCDGDTLRMISLWNPSTRECKYISIPTSISNKFRDDFSNYGVFHDGKIDDYKLFLVVVNDGACSEVWVCALGSNSWESIGFIPYDTSSYHICLTPLNGIIHWIGYTKVIFSFDIVQGRNKHIQVPPCYLDDELYLFDDMQVRVLGENLYLSVNARYKSDIDLWVMKDYGVTDSWSKIFSISANKTIFDSLWPLHYLENSHKILCHGYVNKINDEDSNEAVLVSYNLINGELVTLDIPYKPKHFYSIIFVGSLVSLNSCEFLEATQISEVA